MSEKWKDDRRNVDEKQVKSICWEKYKVFIKVDIIWHLYLFVFIHVYICEKIIIVNYKNKNNFWTWVPR